MPQKYRFFHHYEKMIILAADMTQAQIFAVSRHRLTPDGEGVTTLVTFNGCPKQLTFSHSVPKKALPLQPICKDASWRVSLKSSII